MDLVNICSVGGKTRHSETRQKYPRDLKYESYLVVKWISGESNETDISPRILPVQYSTGTLECSVKISEALSEQGC